MKKIYEKIILDNGLRIVSHKMLERHSAALGIWINIGGRYENSGNKGISHFIEHLLFKGSRHYSCRQIKESIEGVGGSLNGFTSEELTCYLVKVPAVNLDLGLNVLSDMVINPTFPPREVEKEKTVILEELKMYKDLPQSYVNELLDELLWPRQPLGEPIIGSVESVRGLTRKAMLDFKERNYTPSNIVVAACGNINYGKLTKRIGKMFSQKCRSNKNLFVAAVDKQNKPKLKLFFKDTEQTHMALCFRTFGREHPLKHALGLLHVILGANMSSRLFNEVRERWGLAYEIGTHVKRFRDTGAFIVHAGIDNSKVLQAVPLILKELAKVKKDLVSVDEFKRAKEFYVGQLRLALEDTLEYMLWIGESTALLDKTFSLHEIIAQVNRVERVDLREVARKIFHEANLNLSLISPLKVAEDKIYKKLIIG